MRVAKHIEVPRMETACHLAPLQATHSGEDVYAKEQMAFGSHNASGFGQDCLCIPGMINDVIAYDQVETRVIKWKLCRVSLKVMRPPLERVDKLVNAVVTSCDHKLR